VEDGKECFKEENSGDLSQRGRVGDGIFGIEAASLHNYGKSAMALSAEEASRLAAVLPTPEVQGEGGSAYVEKRAAVIYHIMVKRAS